MIDSRSRRFDADRGQTAEYIQYCRYVVVCVLLLCEKRKVKFKSVAGAKFFKLPRRPSQG